MGLLVKTSFLRLILERFDVVGWHNPKSQVVQDSRVFETLSEPTTSQASSTGTLITLCEPS